LEADLVSAADLREYVARPPNGRPRLELQCVLDDALYRQLGSPQGCVRFRDGYWWSRYLGERYLPLFSNDQDQLNELCRALFPEYFRA
jgi:hypothetical protein